MKLTVAVRPVGCTIDEVEVTTLVGSSRTELIHRAICARGSAELAWLRLERDVPETSDAI